MSEPFPDGNGQDELGEAHADLALVDTWVAGLLITYVTDGTYVPARTDVLEELDDCAPEFSRYGTGTRSENSCPPWSMSTISGAPTGPFLPSRTGRSANCV